MLLSSPCEKKCRSIVNSPATRPFDQQSQLHEAIDLQMASGICSPKSPMAFRLDRVDLQRSAGHRGLEASLGKRARFESPVPSRVKENLDGSMSSSRQQKLKDLDERYKLMSQKLSASKFATPSSKDVFKSADNDVQLLDTPGSASRVLAFKDQNITPQKKPTVEESGSSKSDRKEAISVDADETVTVSAKTEPPAGFQVDPETKLTYRAYAARTNNGIFRSYNEDRVSIIQKIFVDSKQQCPTSFFGLFDGHSGARCADYLRDKMHEHVTKQKAFKSDKSLALRLGIAECEADFSHVARQAADNSGSCALVCLLENDRLTAANVGDSRLVLSKGRGSQSQQVTQDHKPESEGEKARIMANGGSIFRSKRCSMKQIIDSNGLMTEVVDEVRYGPFRVEPGGLSVSRTIGDLPAKDPARRGNPRCVVAEADVFEVRLEHDHDFMVLACDGVFDVLTTEQVVQTCWQSLSANARLYGLREACRLAAEAVMKAAFDNKSMDNVTVIVVAFQPDKYYYSC
jgi:serine/threonine protein phosphatase PrpC